MSRIRLHLDADLSYGALAKALRERGHDVTRTPCAWMPAAATDRSQLLEATARGRCILTFNIADFARLAAEYPDHRGIVLAHQLEWTLSSLIVAVDHFLTVTEAEEMHRQVRWLNDGR